MLARDGRQAGRTGRWLGVFLLWCLAGPVNSVSAQGSQALGSPAGGAVPLSPAAPASSGAAASGSESDRAVVVPAAALGIDPVVGEHLSAQMAATATELGYTIVDVASTTAAAQSVGATYPPPAADLWKMVYAARATAGLSARAWAQGGRYMVEIQVALLDGRGPFVTRGAADEHSFLSVVDGLVRSVLPPPGPAAALPTAAIPAAAGFVMPPSGSPEQAFEPAGGGASRADVELPPLRRIALAVGSESAFGLGSAGFYNHVIGARFDVRLTREIVMGAYLGYVNASGYQERVHNLLSYLQIEDRVPISDRSRLSIPLRLAIGFVPRNGVYGRLAAGLAFASSDRLEWGIDLISPALWALPEGGVAASLNVAVEVIISP